MKRSKTLLAALLPLLFAASCAERQDTIDGGIDQVGAWFSVNNDVADLSLGEDYFFVASNEGRGFRVFNRDEEGSPQPVGSYTSDDSLYAPGDNSFISSFLLADSLLMLKLQTNLLVFNVADPFQPRFLRPIFASGVNQEDGYHDAASGYTYMVYCDRSDGIVVRKFSDLDTEEHPDQAGRWFYDGSNPPAGYRFSFNSFSNDGNDLVLRDDLLFLANGRYGLTVLRFNGDPVLADLSVIAQLGLPGDALRLSLEEDLLVVAMGGNGFAVIDVADPSRPYLRSVESPGGTSLDVEVVDEHAFLANSSKGLLVYNLSDPRHPRLSYQRESRYARRLRVDGDRVYVADRDDGLLILDNPLR